MFEFGIRQVSIDEFHVRLTFNNFDEIRLCPRNTRHTPMGFIINGVYYRADMFGGCIDCEDDD